jgi:long-chain acyl-CoA synthetase
MSADLFERLQQYARKCPNDVALQLIRGDQRQVLTWQTLLSEIELLGRRLQRIGASRTGAHVAILMEDSPMWGVAFLAAYSAGWVIVPLDPSRDSATLSGIVAHADCEALIFSAKYAAAARELAGANNGLALLESSSAGGEGALRTDGLLPLVKRDLDGDLAIIYTGGTTGYPKGVRLTEANLFWSVWDALAVCPWTARDHLLSILPLFHIMGLLMSLLGPLYMGARVTYLHDYDPVRLVRTFNEEGITIFACPPQFYDLLIRRIREQGAAQSALRRIAFHRMLDLSRFLRRRLKVRAGRWLFRPIHERFGPDFRLFVVSAASFAPEAAETLLDLGFNLTQAYGMTETGLVTVDPPGANGGLTCGRRLAHANIRIHKPNREGIGEILIAGEHLTPGYWKESQATEELLRDGWLWSGDLGWIDPSGRLRVTGRGKEVIVLGSGRNVFPEQVEYQLRKGSEFIKEVCVLGRASGDGAAERLHAIVVPDFDRFRTRGVVNIQDQIRYDIENVTRALPAYQHINSLEIRETPLPRTSTGKLKRFEVLPRFASPTKLTEYKPANHAEPALFALIRRIKTECGPISPESHLELDLGFDSLERIELLSNIRVFLGIDISNEQAARIFTVEDLARFVGTAAQAVDEQWVSWHEILRAPLSDEQRRLASLHLSRRPVSDLALFVGSRLAAIAAKFLLRFRVTGIEVIPREYPYVICANHVSSLDAFLIAISLPLPAFRRLFFIGRKKSFRTALRRWLGVLIHALPIDADGFTRTTLRLGYEGLKQGLVLCVFPEGHRSIDGSLLPFHKGPGILAIESGVPIVPVGIIGTEKVLGRGSRRFHLSPVQVRFGPPIRRGSRHDAKVAYEELTAHLQAAIGDLIRPPAAATLSEDSTHGIEVVIKPRDSSL